MVRGWLGFGEGSVGVILAGDLIDPVRTPLVYPSESFEMSV